MAKLNEKAILVHLQISMWTGAKKDSRVTGETCDRYGAESDAGSWWTYFLPPKDVAELRAASSRLRNEFKRGTQPWMDKGTRIIPSMDFMTYAARMRKAQDDYNNVVDVFLKERYPAIVSALPERLKTLLDGRQMPKASEIRSKYGAKMHVFPVPNVEDFRVNLGKEEEEEIRAQVTNSIQEMSNRAMNSVWTQFLNVVEKLESTLKNPDRKFHDSLVGNLIDMCIQLKTNNLIDDENLESMRQEAIKTLCRPYGSNVEALKKDKTVRKEAAKSARELIEKMKGYMG